MPKTSFIKLTTARRTVFITLILQAFWTSASDANEIEPKPSNSAVSNPSRSADEATSSTSKEERSNPLLNGGVSVFQLHSLIGKWNGHIKKFGRHPKLCITQCDDGQIAGTYKGIFGTFPVTGQYDEATGNITIHVDFSASKLTRIKRLRSGHGIIEANIQNGVLIGRASIADLGPKSVRWEAVKDPKDVSVSAQMTE